MHWKLLVSLSVDEQTSIQHLQHARYWWEHKRFEELFPRSPWSGQGRIRLCTLKPIIKVIKGEEGMRGESVL